MNLNSLVKTPGFPSQPPEQTELAAFGAGCFWGVESEFRNQPGVLRTSVGFMGGRTPNPTYQQVCYEQTGHAEIVLLEFDPNVVSYETLLNLFWNIHNPTTLNRQGPDIGDQYRSAIFYMNEAQCQKATEQKKKLDESGELNRPVVTQIIPASEFTPAEDYHQQYVERRHRL